MTGIDLSLGALLVRLRDESGWLQATALTAPTGGSSPRDDQAVLALGSALARARLHALRAVVDGGGWPDAERVGPDGARAALDLLVSAEPDIEFVQRCHGLVAQAANAGKVPAWHRAGVHDHLALLEHGTQRFGTRLRLVEGRWEAAPLADPDGVDDHRRAVGLPPLSQVLADLNLSDPV